MFKLKKLALIFATVLLTMTLAIQSAYAGKVTINLGHGNTEGSAYDPLAKKFAELAAKYSNGSIEVKVRCCAQLVKEDEAFKAMQLGTVDMAIITGNNLSPHFGLTDAFVLPYIFKDKAHAYKVLEGPVGDSYKKKLLDATGITILAFGFVGDRDFYNSRKPIKSMADMKGLKVRVPKNQVMIDTFKEFGAAPIALPWADTPTALQTGTVQGADNGTSFIKSAKFYEIMPYFTALEHFTYFSPLMASPKLMKKLDADQKKAVIRAGKEANDYQKAVMSKRVGEIRKFLTTEGQGGMKTTEFDRTDFIAAGQRVQDRYATSKGAEFTAFVNAIRAAAN
jgi:tripartite ATP-independent transporter DctP family solute receptor